MMALVLIAMMGAVVSSVTWWTNRRWNQVDSYHERERQYPVILDVGPPIFDIGDWLDGGRI
jgi:hypothetical protein